jgi:hypothetical protein
MRRKMFIEVRGKQKSWIFEFSSEEQFIEEWRADGLEVNVIEATIPDWVADLGLAGLWSRLQGAWTWLRLW